MLVHADNYNQISIFFYAKRKVTRSYLVDHVKKEDTNHHFTNKISENIFGKAIEIRN